MLDPGAEDRYGETVVGGEQVLLREPAAGGGRQVECFSSGQVAEGLAHGVGRPFVHVPKVAFGPLDGPAFDGLHVRQRGCLAFVFVQAAHQKRSVDLE